jgi:hypothetical protein
VSAIWRIVRPDADACRLRGAAARTARPDGTGTAGELLHVLMLSDFARANAISDLWTLAELLIDAEEDKYVRALLVGMLRERQHRGWRT